MPTLGSTDDHKERGARGKHEAAVRSHASATRDRYANEFRRSASLPTSVLRPAGEIASRGTLQRPRALEGRGTHLVVGDVHDQPGEDDGVLFVATQRVSLLTSRDQMDDHHEPRGSHVDDQAPPRAKKELRERSEPRARSHAQDRPRCRDALYSARLPGATGFHGSRGTVPPVDREARRTSTDVAALLGTDE
ncbi:hypothetical protein HPB47_023059 [Ixodes persulcatus]|uniref:Uncharacterized protein n=1 Tax=Ixodes persulcatus TaxID=34615 RepID=A0AC60QA13_IXOPE|nr:hypothetical protein HPB47_023059 [Ixodes persulcatus]